MREVTGGSAKDDEESRLCFAQLILSNKKILKDKDPAMKKQQTETWKEIQIMLCKAGAGKYKNCSVKKLKDELSQMKKHAKEAEKLKEVSVQLLVLHTYIVLSISFKIRHISC